MAFLKHEFIKRNITEKNRKIEVRNRNENFYNTTLTSQSKLKLITKVMNTETLCLLGVAFE